MRSDNFLLSSRFSTILAATFIVLAVTASAAPDLQKAQQLVNEAVRLLQAQSVEEALDKLAEAIEEEPGFAPAHYYSGLAQGQLQRHGDAFDAFVRAGELDPGNGEAYRMATISAFHTQRFDDCWQQAILAAQAGVDMSQAIQELRNFTPPPEDLEARLAAPRVVVAPIDVSRLAAGDADPGAGVGQGSGSILAQAQADIEQIRLPLALALVESPGFAVVQAAENARYVIQIEADEIDGSGRSLQGFLRVRDRESSEIVYSRQVEMSNITSTGSLRSGMKNRVELLERWAHEQDR